MATGDPGFLLAAAARLGMVGDGFDGHGQVVSGTAGSLAGPWTGQAASAYQGLSAIVAARFHAAAGTSRAAASALKAYGAELDRSQREGMTARSAGVLGVVAAAAADAQAVAAQAALSLAQSDEQAASRALSRAEDEFRVWQARGRRAWEEAQSAADRASGSLQGLTISPPPLAGAVVAPLVATAPFAREEGCGEAPGGPEEPTVGGGLLVDPIPESPLMREIMTGRDPKPGDGVIKDPIPDQPPLREGMSGREPTPGENTITDPAPEPCGRHQVNDQGGNAGGDGDATGERDTSIGGIVSDPGSLDGKNPADVIRELGGAPPGWQEGTLGQGSHAGQGWTLREIGENGEPTGAVIRYHPGGGHHGPEPYWRVSSPEGGKSGIIPGSPWP